MIVFYKAMIIFAAKHYSANNARLFSFLINIAIYLRAGVALLHRFVKQMALPFADGVLFFAGVYFLKMYWEKLGKRIALSACFYGVSSASLYTHMDLFDLP